MIFPSCIPTCFRKESRPRGDMLIEHVMVTLDQGKLVREKEVLWIHTSPSFKRFQLIWILSYIANGVLLFGVYTFIEKAVYRGFYVRFGFFFLVLLLIFQDLGSFGIWLRCKIRLRDILRKIGSDSVIVHLRWGAPALVCLMIEY